ncbi:ATP-binding protein [Ectopseudomonas chengduensis]
MTVFVAGIHGVGKTYICQQYSQNSGVTHESASGLIRKERALAEWSKDKRVTAIDDNQAALKVAVQRIKSEGRPLLLDGHFVLINSNSEITPINASVFKELNLTGVILIEASPEVITSRLSSRDTSKSAIDIDLFLQAERAQAEFVCKTLELPLEVLFQPDNETFARTASKFFGGQ